MYKILFHVLILLAQNLSIADGYKIDQSCRDEGIYDEVESALHSAFDMAQAGLDALSGGYYQKPLDAHVRPPRPQELEDLIRNIFAHDDIVNNQCPNIVGTPRDFNYRMNLKNLRLRTVFITLEKILSNMRNPVTLPTDQMSRDDVVIYCNHSRFSVTDAILQIRKWVTDNDRRGIRMGTGRDDVYQCSVKNSGSTVGVTWPQPVGNIAIGEAYHRYPAAIQLCKGTVTNVKAGWFNDYYALKKRSFRGTIFKSRIKESSDGRKLDQVDAFNVLDVTLLHEMTHASGAGILDDVKVWRNAIRAKAYGWKRIKKLAKDGPYVDRQSKVSADWNAESVAYFALGCFLMSDRDDPRIIGDDGVLQSISDGSVVFPKSE